MMSKGGLSGNIASFMFAAMVMVFTLPFAINSFGGFTQTKWSLVIGSGAIGAIGLLSFVGMLTKAKPMQVSSLFVIMTIVQIACPIIYQLFVTGGMTATKGVGFGFAIVAAILLSI
jgi:quinol-cytochrome oxidoreductase complex cytochrome b subunit